MSRAQTVLATGAALSAITTVHLAAGAHWPAASFTAFVLLLLAEAAHRNARTAAQAAERRARPPDTTSRVLTPCCDFWTGSKGREHTSDCHTRRTTP